MGLFNGSRIRKLEERLRELGRTQKDLTATVQAQHQTIQSILKYDVATRWTLDFPRVYDYWTGLSFPTKEPVGIKLSTPDSPKPIPAKKQGK